VNFLDIVICERKSVVVGEFTQSATVVQVSRGQNHVVAIISCHSPIGEMGGEI